MLRRVGRHSEQLRLCKLLQHRLLVDQHRIEDRIRVVLVGENIFFLALPNLAPHGNGLPGTAPPESGVAHNAPQKPCIRGGNPVVLIDVQRGQGRDIDFKLARIRNPFRAFGIEAVDALDDENVLIPHGHRAVVVSALAGFKIINGQIHLFAGQKVADIRIEQLQVQGLQAFKIVVAVRIQRRLVPGQEPVVHGQNVRAQSKGAELDGEPVRGRCFA